MNKKNFIWSLVLMVSMGAFTLIGVAQWNYECAITAALNSEGTDGAIEDAMCMYGFCGDWTTEYNMSEKIKALFTDTKCVPYGN